MSRKKETSECLKFLEDNLILIKKKSEYQIILRINSNSISIEYTKNKITEWETELCNIGGCDTRNVLNQELKFLNIHIYLKKKYGKIFKRKLKIIKLKGSKDIVNKYEQTIRWICTSSDISFIEILNKDTFPPKKRALTIVNKVSGYGKTMNIFYDCLVPTLKFGWYTYTTVFTESSEHIQSIGTNFEWESYDVIIFVSGDGTIHQFINGMAIREDWEKAFNVPLCHISAGKGNAVASSVHAEVFEKNTITANLYTLLKGKPKNILLSAVTLDDFNTNRVFYSILTMNWGIIATADIESNKYSHFGNIGIGIGALKAIVSTQKYNIEFKFLHQSDSDPQPFDPKLLLEDSVKRYTNSYEKSEKCDSHQESFGIITSQFRMLTEFYEFSQNIKVGGNKLWLFNLHGMNTKFNFLRLLIFGKSFDEWSSILSMNSDATGIYLSAQGGEVVIDGEHVHTGAFKMKQIIIPVTPRILCRDE